VSISSNVFLQKTTTTTAILSLPQLSWTNCQSFNHRVFISNTLTGDEKIDTKKLQNRSQQ